MTYSVFAVSSSLMPTFSCTDVLAYAIYFGVRLAEDACKASSSCVLLSSILFLFEDATVLSVSHPIGVWQSRHLATL